MTKITKINWITYSLKVINDFAKLGLSDSDIIKYANTDEDFINTISSNTIREALRSIYNNMNSLKPIVISSSKLGLKDYNSIYTEYSMLNKDYTLVALLENVEYNLYSIYYKDFNILGDTGTDGLLNITNEDYKKKNNLRLCKLNGKDVLNFVNSFFQLELSYSKDNISNYLLGDIELEITNVWEDNKNYEKYTFEVKNKQYNIFLPNSTKDSKYLDSSPLVITNYQNLEKVKVLLSVLISCNDLTISKQIELLEREKIKIIINKNES